MLARTTRNYRCAQPNTLSTLRFIGPCSSSLGSCCRRGRFGVRRLTSATSSTAGTKVYSRPCCWPVCLHRCVWRRVCCGGNPRCGRMPCRVCAFPARPNGICWRWCCCRPYRWYWRRACRCCLAIPPGSSIFQAALRLLRR